ncbi:hypothetical protein F4677DRAFT_404473 [Hypoxylon crocopeplum]|nr:hypothetical protein F4677DRAFT_404473 [Hypoxylon crocopeplum]
MPLGSDINTITAKLDKAQTFPLSFHKPPPKNHIEAWMVAEVAPYSRIEQKRVCYPNLEPWRPQDGERHLNCDLEATIKELRTNDEFLGLRETLRENWSIKFERSYRRMEGSDTTVVPTIMVVAWSENDRGYSAVDGELWVKACGNIVMFLRDHDASYFGVEIVHWDMLDYRVVA